MIVGWLGIILQFLSILILGSFWIGLRHLYDEGRGLIHFVNQLQLIHIEQETIWGILTHLPIDGELIIKLLFIFFFLMMGILLLQMILVVISSFIANIEEAGNVQGPFYLILLGIYYFTLSMNTPYQMSEGIGYVCSFLPFLNMLFMPCRLLIQDVKMIELVLSAIISSICMMLILAKGPSIYQRGVLDYSSKGFLTVLKKTFFDVERISHEREKRDSLENISCILLVVLIGLSFAIKSSKILVGITLFTGITVFTWLTFLAVRDDTFINYSLIKCECMSYFVIVAVGLFLNLNQPIVFIGLLLLLLFLVSKEYRRPLHEYS